MEQVGGHEHAILVPPAFMGLRPCRKSDIAGLPIPFSDRYHISDMQYTEQVPCGSPRHATSLRRPDRLVHESGANGQGRADSTGSHSTAAGICCAFAHSRGHLAGVPWRRCRRPVLGSSAGCRRVARTLVLEYRSPSASAATPRIFFV